MVLFLHYGRVIINFTVPLNFDITQLIIRANNCLKSLAPLCMAWSMPYYYSFHLTKEHLFGRSFDKELFASYSRTTLLLL